MELCKKTDCKYFNKLIPNRCSYHNIKTYKRYKPNNGPSIKIKTITIPTDSGEEIKISETHYKKFMKLKNIEINKSFIENEGLVLEYRSLCGNIKGRVKFKNMGKLV